MMDGLVRSQNALGIESICYDPSTGRPLLALDPRYIGFDDEAMTILGLNPGRDRYLWNEDGTPIYQTKVEQIPASLRQKTMAAVVPGWKDTQVIEANVRQAVTIVAPAPWVPKAQRAEQIVEGEFKEIAPPKSVEQLRAERAELLKRAAAEHLANPNRVTRPNSPPAYTGGGRPSFGDPVEHTAAGHDASKPSPTAAPYVAPQPQPMPAAPMAQPVPSYVRRPGFGQPVQQTRPDGSHEPMQSSRTVRR